MFLSVFLTVYLQVFIFETTINMGEVLAQDMTIVSQPKSNNGHRHLTSAFIYLLLFLLLIQGYKTMSFFGIKQQFNF